MKRSLPLIALLTVAVLLPGCVNREAQKQAKRTQEVVDDKSVAVTLLPVTPTDFVNSFEITGQITTDTDTQVGAKVAARLVSVYVRDGDAVKAGQAIAQQDTSDLAAQARQAMAAVRTAQSQLNQALAEAKQGPRRSTSGVAGAEARLKQARANLEKVRKGAREEERRQVQAQVRAAKSNMETVKRELDRDEELFKQGAISKEEVERSRNAYQAALSQYEQALENWRMMQAGSRSEDIVAAEQQVRSAEEDLTAQKSQKDLDVQYGYRVESARSQVEAANEQLRIAQNNLREATIRSPFAGVVSGQPVQAGTFVSPGVPVVRIISPSGIYFSGEIPESRIGIAQPGKSVSITAPALGGASLQGEVVAVDPVGSQTGRIFKARIRLLDPVGPLKAGMFATGTIEVSRVDAAITVPSDAIIRKEGKTVVFIAQAGKAKRVEIRVLDERRGVARVGGLASGSEVIVRGQDAVNDGTAIRTLKDSAAKPKASEAK